MARISNTSAYPNIGTPVASDYLILTDKSDNLVTKTATLADVQKLFGLDTLVAKVTVNSASLLTLNTTAATLVNAPGAGKAIDLISVNAFFQAGNQAYDFGNNLEIKIGTVVFGTLGATETNSVSDIVSKVEAASGTKIIAPNTGVVLSTSSAPSQGTGTAYFNIFYRVLNVDSTF